MNLTKKLTTAFATSAVLLNALTPAAFASTTLNISGNGSHSDNTANVSMNQSNSVVQNNTANITNNVDVKADTGGNRANDNTGGDVTVRTGDADVKAKINNAVNMNVANVDCCQNGDTLVKIDGNGTRSDNNANLDINHSNEVYQDNRANVDNNVEVRADSGNNDANDNTGGDVLVRTGDVSTKVLLDTKANANIARIGNGNENGGDLSLKILDNGSHSDNDVDLSLDNSVLVRQDNDAYIDNTVDVKADSGRNDANDNTGGDVAVISGDADVKVGVDNMTNFNSADLNCGCLIDDLTAKIDGNGTDSENDIDAYLDTSSEAFQDNRADLNNRLDDIKAKTGHNDANDNTAHNYSDPTVWSGDADVKVNASNSGNVNVVGHDTPSLSDLNFDFNLDFGMDLSHLFDLLGNMH